MTRPAIFSTCMIIQIKIYVQNTGICYPGQGWFVRNLGWGRSVEANVYLTNPAEAHNYMGQLVKFGDDSLVKRCDLYYAAITWLHSSDKQTGGKHRDRKTNCQTDMHTKIATFGIWLTKNNRLPSPISVGSKFVTLCLVVCLKHPQWCLTPDFERLRLSSTRDVEMASLLILGGSRVELGRGSLLGYEDDNNVMLCEKKMAIVVGRDPYVFVLKSTIFVPSFSKYAFLKMITSAIVFNTPLGVRTKWSI